MKDKLLFLDPEPGSMTYKMIYYLKDYFNIALVSFSTKYNSEEYKKLGIEIYNFNVMYSRYFKDKKIFQGINEFSNILLKLIKLKKENFKYVLARTEPNWIGFLAFTLFRKAKKIYFPYDITLFRYKNPKGKISNLEFKFEKYCFENADFIVHKGPEKEISWIKEYNVKGRPIQFLPYCFDPWILPIKKQSQKLKGTHLVYAGVSVSFDPNFKMSEVFRKISEQGIDFHLYPTSIEEETKKIKNKYFHLHEPVPNLELNKKMGQYHYGTRITFEKSSEMDERWHKTALSNKIFSYLEAGIPLIVDNMNEFVTDLIKEHKIGVVISIAELSNLKDILNKQNYKELLKNVEKVRSESSMKKNIKRLVSRLQQV